MRQYGYDVWERCSRTRQKGNAGWRKKAPFRGLLAALFVAACLSPSPIFGEISSGGRYSGRYPIESFSDLPEREKGYVICGAFFVAILVVAIFYISRDES